MKLQEITVGEIADILRDCGPEREQACLLIGAGVSYSAGIGLSSDFVKKIKERFENLYDKACRESGDGKEPGYAQCMAALPPAKQVELIREDIDQAKINWAHIGIARLEKSQKISAILTTNFDPLASRACAIFHRFPAIYDLAGLRDEQNSRISFDRSYVKGSAIFHLHGQHTGFVLLNTDEKLNAQADRIKPVLDAVMKGKPVIIAGYSGENDPLIDRIADLAPFNHGLFWVCRDDKDPAPSVCRKLLALENCYLVRNKPSDVFFTELANALDLDPPAFLANLFEHMTEILSGLRPYSDLGELGGPDLLESAKQQLEKANNAKSDKDRLVDQLTALMAAGNYAEISALYRAQDASISDQAKDLFAWAEIVEGNSLSDQANTKQGDEADTLFTAAGAKYAAALAIKPGIYEALTNWGIALADQAETKQGDEADALFAAAGEKYAAALAIKPDMHDALHGWGVALSGQAETKQGEEADALFAAAGEKYAAALAIKPDMHEALNNWGVALSTQAKIKQADEADALFNAAGEKYAAALAIKRDKYETLTNLGECALRSGQNQTG
ncbi:MAG: SIR2 family protein [Erythrobacter sp.]|uniref:SIR2 family protein n=1 Tax=Erythrobacter sp. TaxID=1042 RepID=UPI0025F5D247|nr:SIR2 family protein [Erythrobacter sp.]MCL9999012.1 SIR2 family protein [Erythrobacter sp.]